MWLISYLLCLQSSNWPQAHTVIRSFARTVITVTVTALATG